LILLYSRRGVTWHERGVTPSGRSLDADERGFTRKVIVTKEP
jgi:hypothetical protein